MWDSKRKHLVVAAAVTALVLTLHIARSTLAIPAQCLTIRASLEPAPDFIASRTAHGWDRFVEGTSPVLILIAKILTGARNGTEIVFGDVLLDKGVILGIGYIPRALSLRPSHWRGRKTDFSRHRRRTLASGRVFCTVTAR
ncbi:hypothetical protein B0H13DRAFT_1084060 [Mycena leptocephala]|jgi:hypothetical protein|nr:hypothetical protein B0H13DRAFT_1084060 [Mycena leptocephala]